MIILSLGTNLGDKRCNLKSGIAELNKIGKIINCSNIYETVPWGFESENRFWNIAVEYTTSLTAMQLLEATQTIEKKLGRTAKTSDQYTDRIIDIDIIDYNGMSINSEPLTLPHPRMHIRNFVLYPLCDIAPEWQHPILKITASELKKRSTDKEIPAVIDNQVLYK